MTDAEALALLDVNSLWLFSNDSRSPARNLREAIVHVLENGDTVRLIRPGGVGERATWIEHDQILRLAAELVTNASAHAA